MPSTPAALLCMLGVFGCASDGELPVGDLGGTPPSEAALMPERPSMGPDPDDPWWCLGQEPSALPAPRRDTLVGFVLPVVEWSTQQPLAGRGLTARLCPAIDFSCTTPLFPPYAIRDATLNGMPLPLGAAGIPVPEGFGGFLRFDVEVSPAAPPADDFMPTSYFLAGVVSGDISVGPPVTLIRRGEFGMMLDQSFPGLTAGPFVSSSVTASVRDCNGQPVVGARVEVSRSGASLDGVVPFQLPPSGILVAQPLDEPLLTGDTGAVGYVNVPAGAMQLLAFRPGDSEPFARAELGVVPGQNSLIALRPVSLTGASLTPSL